jgi:hypothetical protein
MSGLGQLPCSSGRAPPGHDATAATAKNDDDDDDDDDDVDEKVVAARRPAAAAASRDELNFIRRTLIIFCLSAHLSSHAKHWFSFLPESREDSFWWHKHEFEIQSTQPVESVSYK